MIVISSFRCGPANFLPPNGILYIFFLSFSSLLFFSFFHSYMMITIKCRYHIAAHSQLPFGEFTNGYHTARRPVFESLSLSLWRMSLFFVSRVFFVLQFNISSRNSAQKDGGRPHDLRATNSRIRGEERRGKKKERIPARWVNCLRPISTSWNRGRMNGEHWKEKVLTIFLVRTFEIFQIFLFFNEIVLLEIRIHFLQRNPYSNYKLLRQPRKE